MEEKKESQPQGRWKERIGYMLTGGVISALFVTLLSKQAPPPPPPAPYAPSTSSSLLLGGAKIVSWTTATYPPMNVTVNSQTQQEFGGAIAISGDGSTLVVARSWFPLSSLTNRAGLWVYNYSSVEQRCVPTHFGEQGGEGGILFPSSFYDNGTPARSWYANSVAISHNGTVIAATELPYGAHNGYIHMFMLESNTSYRISAPGGTTTIGEGVALSADGTFVATKDANVANEVYVYRRNGTSWNHHITFIVPMTYDCDSSSCLSFSPYLSHGDGDEWLLSIAVIYDSVMIYRLPSGILHQRITPPVGAGAFATSLTMSTTGSTLLVGDRDSYSYGCAFVYQNTGVNGTYVLEAQIFPTYNATYNEFGQSVAISSKGDVLVVADATGAQGSTPGYVYTYVRDVVTGKWTLAGTPMSVGPLTAYGYALALTADGNTLFVGAPYTNQRRGVVWHYRNSYAMCTCDAA